MKESCEDPDLTAPLQDLITVTDLRTHVHYRNRFCALCNGLDETVPLTTWDIRIACDRILFASDPNFVLNIKQRYCNLLFEFPKETATQTCVMPPYTISKCNETKLWPIYDEAIDLACDAFLDPFNLTYKNYFCYVCNTAEPIEYDEEKCKGVKFHDFNDVTPSFSLIINLDNIIPAKSEDTLNCDKGTQFEDHKLVKHWRSPYYAVTHARNKTYTYSRKLTKCGKGFSNDKGLILNERICSQRRANSFL